MHMRRSIRLALTALVASGVVAATVLAVARPTMALEAGATFARGGCNNSLIFEGTEVTDEDGGFEFKQQTANRNGADALRIHAQNLVTGEACDGGLTGRLGIG